MWDERRRHVERSADIQQSRHLLDCRHALAEGTRKKESTMKNGIRSFATACAVAVATLLTGCGSYYMVRDPANGNTYYTSDVDRAGDAGAVRFKDEKSGKVVTLQESEVKKIDKYEYRSATSTQ